MSENLTAWSVLASDEAFPDASACGDIAICVRGNGSPWLLGTGAHGTVRSPAWSQLMWNIPDNAQPDIGLE